MFEKTTQETIMARWKQELRPDRWLPGLTVGLVAGSLDIMIQISFALLIFSGDLSVYASRGIGLTLFAALAIGLAVALLSSLPGMVAIPQDSPAALLAVVAAAVAVSMPASGTSESLFATVVAAVALTSLLAGLFFLVLGFFKQGSLVRYIPYPVVGGFLAGTGWLLVQGAVDVMAGASLTLSQLPYLFQAGVLLRWLPGLVLAVVLLLVLRRYSHFLVMPAMMAGAMGLSYLVLWLAGLSLAEASAQGWLLGPFPEGALWQPLTPALLAEVHWPAIVGQLGSMGTILIVSVVSLLLNASGLELVARRDVDLNRELKAAGLGNILSSLGGGGPVGYQALSISALSQRTGVPSRLVGVSITFLCGFLLLFGTSLLSFFPRVVIGALLLFLGLSFLVEWLYDAWFKLSKLDYAVVVLILVAMNVVGVLAGVGLGLALAVILFVVDYSRVDVVRHALSGVSYRSKVDRPRLFRRLLRQKGEWLYILELQGYLFFGTANSLLDRIRQRLDAPDQLAPRFVVLDFRRVSGMDGSAVMSFAKMVQLARAQGFVVVLTHLSPRMQRQLTQEAGSPGEGSGWRAFPDLDHGVEWCEGQMIQIFESVGLAAKPKTVMRQLEEFLSRSERFAGWQEYAPQQAGPDRAAEPDAIPSVLPYMEHLEVEAGQVLIRQGEPPRGLYLVESGRVTIQLESDQGPPTRLRARGPGTVVGEMGLYLGSPASASVVAHQPGSLYYLSREALARMEREDPGLAAAFHRFIARHLSERLLDTTETVQALLD
jgi:SulP family sulfate permease